jgi:hypothetical protein
MELDKVRLPTEWGVDDIRFFVVRAKESTALALVVDEREGDRTLYLKRAGYIDPDTWTPPSLILELPGFVDLQDEYTGLRLCSQRLRDVLERNAGPNDDLQWLPCSITDPEGERRDYWVLHFPNRGASPSTGLIPPRTPPLAPADVQGRHVLPTPSLPMRTFVVSEDVAKAIVAEGCVGLEFRAVKVSS